MLHILIVKNKSKPPTYLRDALKYLYFLTQQWMNVFNTARTINDKLLELTAINDSSME